MGTALTKMLFDAWMEAEGGSNNAWTSEDHHRLLRHRPLALAAAPHGVAGGRPLLVAGQGDDPGEARRPYNNATVRNEQQQSQARHAMRQGRAAPARDDVRGRAPLPPPGHRLPRGPPGGHSGRREGFFACVHCPTTRRWPWRATSIRPRRRPRSSGSSAGFCQGAEPAAGAEWSNGAPVLKGVVRETLTDDVKLPKIIMAWHSPARYAPGDARGLDLFAAGAPDARQGEPGSTKAPGLRSPRWRRRSTPSSARRTCRRSSSSRRSHSRASRSTRSRRRSTPSWPRLTAAPPRPRRCGARRTSSRPASWRGSSRCRRGRRCSTSTSRRWAIPATPRRTWPATGRPRRRRCRRWRGRCSTPTRA